MEVGMNSFDGMGAVYEHATGDCGFRVWAPNATSVKVHADFLGHFLDHHGIVVSFCRTGL